MNRRYVYPGEIPRDLDFLVAQTETMRLVGNLLTDLLDSEIDATSDTYVTRLAGFIPSYLGTMNMTLGAGRVYEYGTLDATAFGTLTSDSRLVFRVGQTDSQTLAFAAAPGVGGQSRIDLVQVKLDVTDGNNTVLAYYNSADPSEPFSGPNNDGTSQPLDRLVKATVSIKAGTASATPVAPTADAGYTPLYYMTIANGQTAVASGNISLAANSALLAGLGKQHHTGAIGSAPKIVLTAAAEVQGTLPVANGGTGATTLSALLSATSPMTTLGDTTYHDGSTPVRLAPNTAAKPARLRMVGTGAAGAAPTWDTAIAVDDFAQNLATTTGLTLGYYGGTVGKGTNITAVAANTVALTLSTTNYVEVDPLTGTVSKNTTGFTPTSIPLMQVVTGSSTITSVTDKRSVIETADVAPPITSNPFAYNPATTTGLTFGFFGGQTRNDNTVATVGPGTVALTLSTTNYVEADAATGTVTKNTVGFTSGKVPLFVIVTGVSTITTITDKRAFMALSGATTASAIPGGCDGKPNPSAKVVMFVADRTYNIATNLAGTAIKCETNPTATATFTVFKNGVSQGTFGITTAGAVTGVAVSAITLVAGDILKVTAPAVQDATLADLYITLQAT